MRRLVRIRIRVRVRVRVRVRIRAKVRVGAGARVGARVRVGVARCGALLFSRSCTAVMTADSLAPGFIASRPA